MSSDFWDEAETSYKDSRSDKPFWALPHDSDNEADEKLIHGWLMSEKDHLAHENRDRFKNIHKNLALFKGLQYKDQDLRQSNRDYVDEKSKAIDKIVLNHLYDLTKSRVSKLLKYKPAVAILPTNDEWEDVISAKMTKGWLDHIWYTERFDGVKVPKWVRNAQPMGESFLFIDWDPDKGDIAKQYRDAIKAAQKMGGKDAKVPLLNEHGEQEVDSNGNPIFVEQPVYNGDVAYRVKMTTDILAQRVPSGEWEDVKYIFEKEIMGVEEARLRWPKRAHNIKTDKDAHIYDYEKMETRQDRHMVEVWTLYHKRTKEMDKGRKIVFTKDGILDNSKFPFSHRNLPCIRFTDIDVPGELHGRSFFDLVKGSTGAHNNLTNMILRNMVTVGHPKWMLPAGSAKLESLGNAITIVQYKGPTAPQLVTAPTTPREFFEFRNLLREEFMQHADVGMTGRGDPPPGITAAVALQYLSELENERWNEAVVKYNECILQTSIMTVAVGGDYYDARDERMIRLLGPNNKWISIAFDSANLSKDYDIRIQSSSALPESKAAKTEYLLYLNERFPQQVDADSVLNMLEIAQSEKFLNVATVSVRAAEAENQMLMNEKENKEVGPPSEEEDHIQHWKIHVRQMREWSFKNQTPDFVQKRFKEHVLATEMLILKKMMQNPEYQKVVQPIMLEGFPVLFQAQATPTMEGDDLAQADPNLPPYNAPIQGNPMMGQVQMGAPTMDAPIQPEEQLPANVPGQEVNPDLPNMEQQLSGAPVPPVPPTSQI